MDFIEGSPSSNGYSIIYVVVDRFTKYGHFMALAHPYSAHEVTQKFLQSIFKLYGFPKTIVSDRDPIFLSSFWKSIFSLQGTTLNYGFAYHSQSDGQTEALNKSKEGYLRCYFNEKPKTWKQWLPLAEWWYNSSFHTTMKFTPFKALYGYPWVANLHLGNLQQRHSGSDAQKKKNTNTQK